MDVKTKKNMLYIFTFLFIFLIGSEIYKYMTTPYPISAVIVFTVTGLLGYGITYLVLSHDIKKFERWRKEAQDFVIEDMGIVSHLSLSSTRENGRNTVIMSVKYAGHEITFSGIHPSYQFKYSTGDEIKLKVHPEDSQRFVLKDLGS